MEKGALEMIEALYQMIAEAWGVPLGNEKCIIEREKALSMLDELKARLPVEISEARRLVMAREEFITSAKKEADSMRRLAEEQARRMVEQQEIVRVARQRSTDMVNNAETVTRELKRRASEFVDQTLRETEESVTQALNAIQASRARFNAAVGPIQSEDAPAASGAPGSPADDAVPNIDGSI